MQDIVKRTLDKTEGRVMNGQFREKGNGGHKTENEDNQNTTEHCKDQTTWTPTK